MSKVFVEGQHRGEFLASEAPGTLSREVGAVAAAAVDQLPDGRAVALVNGKLVPASGVLDSAGELDEEIVGVVFGAYPGEPAERRVYIARLAELKASAVTLHSVTGAGAAAATAAVTKALERRMIVLR